MTPRKPASPPRLTVYRLLIAFAVCCAANAATSDRPKLNKVGEYRLLTPRQGAAAVVHNDAIYVIAGNAIDKGPATDIERFDLTTKIVERLPSEVMARRYHVAAVFGGRIFIFGGQSYRLPGSPFEETIEIFDPATRTVSRGPTMPVPRSNMGAARLGDTLYFVGGSKSKTPEIVSAANVDAFDLRTQRWSAAASLPTARQTAAVAVTGFVVAVGGFRGRAAVTNVDLFVPQENTWKALPPLARRVSAHAAVALDQYIFLFGDYDRLDSVLAYNLKTRATHVLSPGFTGRRHAAAVVHGNTIYVIGGNTRADRGASDLIEAFALGAP